jgi:hypothetical protein
VFGCPEKNMDRLKLEFYNRLNCGYWVVMRFQSFALLIFSLSKTKWIIVRRAMVLCWYQNIKKKKEEKLNKLAHMICRKTEGKRRITMRSKETPFVLHVHQLHLHALLHTNKLLCFSKTKQKMRNSPWYLSECRTRTVP